MADVVITRELPADWSDETRKAFLEYIANNGKEKKAPSKYNCYNCGHGELGTGACKIGSGECVNQVFNHVKPFWWIPR